MASAEFYFRLTSLDCLMDNDYEHFSGCIPLLLFFSSIVHVLTMLFSQCFKVLFIQLMWLYHIKYLNIPILHLIINLNVLVITKTNNVFIKSIFARVHVTMKHYKLFTSVLSLHDLSCTTTCIDSLVYHYAMSSYYTFNMWLVTILTKVYFNRMVYLRTYTNGLVLIIMPLFDHHHILVNSTMQIVHIAHNSVTTTWSGFNTDYNDNWSIFQISFQNINYRPFLEKIETPYNLRPAPLPVPQVTHVYAEDRFVYKLVKMKIKLAASYEYILIKLDDLTFSQLGFSKFVTNIMLESYSYNCYLNVCRTCGRP